MTESSGVTRRGFLRGTVGAAAVGALGLPVLSALSACGTGSTAKVTATSDSVLPNNFPFAGPKPDIAGTAEGVPAGYYSYPASPIRAYPTPPLSNGQVSVLTNIFNPLPPGRDANPAWQEVEKRLGAKVDITIVPTSDYETKLNTVIAGGDLPDLMLYDGDGVSNLADMLKAKCADLTDLLSGDKIKPYQSLADIPKLIWKDGVVAGRLYGIPIPRNITAGVGFVHQEMLDELGIKDTSSIKGADQFLDILKELNRPQDNRWAMGTSNLSIFNLGLFGSMFRIPFMWKVDSSGKFTRSIETEEYRAAVEFAIKVYKAGCFVPGCEGWTNQQRADAIKSGKVAIIADGMPSAPKYWNDSRQINPAFRITPFLPFGHDGGKAVTYLDNTSFGYTMIKKGSEDRVKELIKVVDFLAAPFGTEEYRLFNYGVQGTDFTNDDKGNPVPTDKGKSDINVPWKYVGAPQQVVYDPRAGKEYTDVVHNAYAKLIPLAVEDPTQNLFSPAKSRFGAKLLQLTRDRVTSIIAGRAPMSDLDQLVKDVASQGGDEIRKEFEQAWAQSKDHK